MVVFVVPRHTPRSLVERVDFATSIASPGNRETAVISDLAVLLLHDGGLRLASRHAGVTAEELIRKTGVPLEVGEAAMTPDPTPQEMSALQRLDPGGIRHRLA